MGKVIWEAPKELQDCLKREQTLRSRLEALVVELELSVHMMEAHSHTETAAVVKHYLDNLREILGSDKAETNKNDNPPHTSGK